MNMMQTNRLPQGAFSAPSFSESSFSESSFSEPSLGLQFLEAPLLVVVSFILMGVVLWLGPQGVVQGVDYIVSHVGDVLGRV